MTVYIYADIIIAVSCIVNIPVLWSSARLYGLRFSLVRAFAASVFCGIFALAAVYLKFDFLQMLLLYAVSWGGAVFIAFGKNKFLTVLRISFMLLWYSAVISGVCNVVNMVVNKEIRQYISFGCVILGTAIFCLAVRMKKSAYAVGTEILKINACKLRINLNGSEYILKAIVDSGNMLVEPISQCPVIVVNERDEILNNAIKNCKNKRFVPFSTISGDGVIECTKCDAWLCSEKTRFLGDIYIGISKNIKYEAVVGTAVFNMRSGD